MTETRSATKPESTRISRRSALKLAGAGALAATAGPLLMQSAAVAGDEIDFTVGAPTGKTISKTDFGYNTGFELTGLFHGTLPADDPRSSRAAFAQALSEGGVGALRFPGGTLSLLYLADGQLETEQLTRDLTRLNPAEVVGKLYRPDNPFFDKYVALDDFLEFCEEFDIEPLYGVNTAFYYDKTAGRARAVTLNRWVVRADDGSVVEELYDRERIAEAAAALGDHVDALLAAGHNIRHWEIGNEESLKFDIGRNGLDDVDDERGRYLAIAVAYATVIRARVPDAVISVTSMGRTEEAYDALRAAGADSLFDYAVVHYPVTKGNPPSSKDDQRIEQFVGTDLGMGPAIRSREQELKDHGFARLGIDVTEYKAYTYRKWAVDVDCTVANALVWTHGAGQLVFETNSPINVKHDLESYFWGGLIYNCVLDPAVDPRGRRLVSWIGPDGTFLKPIQTTPDEIPESNWFRDKYFLDAQMKASGLLSRTVGAKAVVVQPSADGQLVSLFAAMRYAESGAPAEAILTFVNRTEDSRDVAATLSGREPGERPWRAGQRVLETDVIRADGEWGLAGVLPGEYVVESGHAQVSAGRLAWPRVRTRLLPYSVTQVRVGLV